MVSNHVWGRGARSCTEQMVWNRVWGEMRGRVWNRCVESCMGWDARSCM